MTHIAWWRWTAGTFAILSFWILGAAVLSVTADMWLPATGAAWEQLAADLITFVPFFVATPVVWQLMTRTGVGLLVSDSGRIRGTRMMRGFLVWFGLSAFGTAVDWVFHSGDYSYTFSVGVFLPFLAVTVLLLPMQCWAEELFFRGWILRWAGARSPWVRVLISGTVFALPHLGNPEAAGQTALALSAWFLLGAGWAYVSVRDGGIELAMGAHLANNAFALLLVGYDDAALPTSAVVTTSTLNAAATVVSLLVMVPLFALFTRPARQ